MASTNCPSSNGSGKTPAKKYDVFISSRAEIQITFTSHVEAALKRCGLNTYIGNELGGGDGISADCVKAIEDSVLSLVVFSKKYANSERCLNGLVKILECSKNQRQMLVPVFYDVDTNTVRKQIGSYAEAFVEHEKNCKGKKNTKKIRSWRKALTEASSYPGRHCTINVRTEHEIGEQIAQDVLKKLDRVDVGDLDSQIEKLERLARFLDSSQLNRRSDITERNHKATLERISLLKTEKKLRMLRLTPDMLSHMEISPTTNSYF